MLATRHGTNRLWILTSLMLGAGLLALAGGCPMTQPPTDNTGDTGSSGDNGSAGDKNSGLTGKYVGSQTCRICHTRTHTGWAGTLHARALDTLEAIGEGTNADCLPCHTVGFGESGGFVDRNTTEDLAGVGCEACHGPARDHVNNVADASLRPTVDISATVCGKCHTGAHHPNFDEWSMSKHATVNQHVADDLVDGGFFVNACGQCHSGTVFYKSILEGQPVSGDIFAGQNPDDLLGIQCANCHDPHKQTGNATEPGDGRDFQLRFPEIAEPFPTNSIDAATNPARFNICGQCHHSRGRDWTATSRGPHHSVQSNIYIGEMPVPDSDQGGASEPLVLSLASVHLRAPEQCATCHMFRRDFQDEQAPAIAGHTFEVNFAGCVASGCHTSQFEVQTRAMTFMASVQSRLDNIEARLGDPSTWEYSATGGPEDQSTISDNVKKIRFLLRYVGNDGSNGIHNPDYVKSMLDEAERLLDVEGL